MKYFYRISIIILALVLVYFFFAPAFAGKINIPSEINFGAFAIRIYGIVLAAAVLVGYFVARKNSWRFGVSPAGVDDLAFWLTIVSVISARIYYVIFNLPLYSSDLSEIYKIWHGGLSIYGGIIGGLLFLLWYSRKKAYSSYQLLDLVALSMPLSQGVGRFGNFFNQEAFGLPTNLPWKMYVNIINRPKLYQQYNFFHPTFLYEAILNVIIFVILIKFIRGKVKPGVLALSYLAMYSFGRFFIESIRLDSLYLIGAKVDLIIAVAIFIAAGAMIMYRQKRAEMV